jgi:hypothetical protein
MRRSPGFRVLASAFALLMAAVFVAGCAMGNIMQMPLSNEVDRAFQSFESNPEYRYYFYGLENNPYAIVGIERNYRINDPDWREVDPRSDRYKKVIDLIRYFPWYNNTTHGGYVVNGEGRRIGVWYSSLLGGMMVHPETGDVIVTLNPDPLRSPL